MESATCKSLITATLRGVSPGCGNAWFGTDSAISSLTVEPETLIAQAIQPQNASKTAARAIFKIKNPASGCPAEGNESNLALWKRLATVSNCVFGTGNLVDGQRGKLGTL